VKCGVRKDALHCVGEDLAERSVLMNQHAYRDIYVSVEFQISLKNNSAVNRVGSMMPLQVLDIFRYRAGNTGEIFYPLPTMVG